MNKSQRHDEMRPLRAASTFDSNEVVVEQLSHTHTQKKKKLKWRRGTSSLLDLYNKGVRFKKKDAI